MLNSDKFKKLSAMGITVWQQRQPELDAMSSTKPSPSILIDQQQLQQSQLFRDILQWLELSFEELTVNKDIIDCGDFNWQWLEQTHLFYDPAKRLLQTPAITEFQQQKQLKQQLWHKLQQVYHDLNL